MKILVYTLVLFGLTACGKDRDSKQLFSAWVPAKGSNVTLDLTGGSVGPAFTSRATMASGEVCTCSTTVTQYSQPVSSNAAGPLKYLGTITASSCAYQAGTGSGSDPGCASLNSTSSYEHNFYGLSVCGSACAEYR